MSERIPTEAEWRLVSKVMGWGFGTWQHFGECHPGCALWIMSRASSMHRCDSAERFRPLHDYNDLGRFVEAMQAAGYLIVCEHLACSALVDVSVFKEHDEWKAQGVYRIATFWACVDALMKAASDAKPEP